MVKSSSSRYVDEFPQFINAKVQESAANTYTETEIPLPVIQSLENGKAMVVEILKALVDIDYPENVAATATIVQMQLSKKTQTAIQLLSDPNILMRFTRAKQNATSVGFMEHTVTPYTLDFTDLAGHGYLIGTPKIFLAIKGTANVSVKSCQIKILYRIRYVSSAELIGIIQE